MQELHYRYYEPLCREVDSLDVLLQGPPVKKLLFMTEAESIAQQHQPFWKVSPEVLLACSRHAVRPCFRQACPAPAMCLYVRHVCAGGRAGQGS